MALILGIDTGGTYTDGVIIDPVTKAVISKAKAFTTPADLTIGIRNCLASLSIKDKQKISFVSLSTTLATNAIVEGRGARVGLLMIGKAPEMKIPTDQWQLLHGKIDIKGYVKVDLDEQEILAAIEKFRHHVDALAVSGYASVRNPSHELRVRQLVREHLDVPVVCAHELTSALGHDERTITCVLNASLIPIINGLVEATRVVLKQFGITAPIMIVKGDGSLMNEATAAERPIETILSGPAASIIGGLYLTGQKEALILDMGGTTTDIAHVENGRTRIRKAGAKVGGWLTHIQAAEICTYGLGGDSYIQFNANGKIEIGPQKVQPLCVAAVDAPNLIHELQDYRKSSEYELFTEQEWDCFTLFRPLDVQDLSDQDLQVIELLRDGPHSLLYLADALGKDAEKLGLSRLVKLGVLTRISLTPTDLLHAAGLYTCWNTAIAVTATTIMAERLKMPLDKFLDDATAEVVNKLMYHCLESVANFDQVPHDLQKDSVAMYFYQQALDSSSSTLLNTKFALKCPIVALGAPVQAWIPPVGNRLQTSVVIPEHADVANAIGAAVGEVMETVEVIIRPGKEHIGFIVHAPWEQRYFNTLDEAKTFAVNGAREAVEAMVLSSGGRKMEIIEFIDDHFTEIFGNQKSTYVETQVRITALGSPIWINPNEI